MDEIPEYSPPVESVLDPFRDGIAERRKKKWPYQAILDWLKKEQSVDVAYSTLWEFCDRRGIKKGGAASVPKPRSASPGQPAVPPSSGSTENRQPAPPQPVPGESSLDLLAEAEERVSQQQSSPFKTIKTSKSS